MFKKSARAGFHIEEKGSAYEATHVRTKQNKTKHVRTKLK